LPVTVILDTNFLFIPIRFGVDIFEQLKILLSSFEPVVPKPVLCELFKLREKGISSLASEVNFALKLVDNCKIIPASDIKFETVDESILLLAKKLDAIVATTDLELKHKLRAEGVPVIYLRQRSYLEIEGKIP
jgi:rRNA-processing protein FCF1